jgi:hypothetical protein
MTATHSERNPKRKHHQSPQVRKPARPRKQRVIINRADDATIDRPKRKRQTPIQIRKQPRPQKQPKGSGTAPPTNTEPIESLTQSPHIRRSIPELIAYIHNRPNAVDPRRKRGKARVRGGGVGGRGRGEGSRRRGNHRPRRPWRRRAQLNHIRYTTHSHPYRWGTNSHDAMDSHDPPPSLNRGEVLGQVTGITPTTNQRIQPRHPSTTKRTPRNHIHNRELATEYTTLKNTALP